MLAQLEVIKPRQMWRSHEQILTANIAKIRHTRSYKFALKLTKK